LTQDEADYLKNLKRSEFLSDQLRTVNNRIKYYSKVFFLKSKTMLDILENLYTSYREKLLSEYRNYQALKILMTPWIEVMYKSKEFKVKERR
jgi:hypothetical protein